jgi:hypothetical protein
LKVSKSKNIMEVLSFVLSVLASLNNKLAIFSAVFSLSVLYRSLVCAVEKANN